MQMSKFTFSILFISIFIVKVSNAQFAGKNLSLFAGLNESKQNINTGNFYSKNNYLLADYQKNGYQSGYFVGFRIDGDTRMKDKVDFSLSYHQIATGTNYFDAKYLSPFTQASSNFKADDHFSMLELNVHYKRKIFTDRNEKRNYYLIAGPSMAIRLADQSEDNQIYNNYRRGIINADIGAEIENNKSYTLFMHYKKTLTSFTNNSINTSLNSFQMGILFKTNNLF